MKFTKVTLRDAEGNEIRPPLCKCGNPSDTVVMSPSENLWSCNKCLYQNDSEERLVYKKYDGSRKVIPSHLDDAFQIMLKEQSKGFYKDKEGNEIDLWTFADLMEDLEYRNVNKEILHGFCVSTVWLGCRFGNDCFFETIVFIENETSECGESVSMHRYQTLGFAEMGHDNIVRLINEGYTKFPDDKEKIIHYMEEQLYGPKENFGFGTGIK